MMAEGRGIFMEYHRPVCVSLYGEITIWKFLNFYLNIQTCSTYKIKMVFIENDSNVYTSYSCKSHSQLLSEQLRTLARGGEWACQTITISQHHICFPAPLLIELLTYVLLCYFPFLLSAHIHLLYSLSLPIFTIILGSLSLYLSPKFCLVNYV